MKSYLSLIKFSHTIFAMPFALIGFFLAVKSEGIPMDWILLVKVVFCMVFARSAAMAFNRWADWKIDARNERTVVREIPAGKIKPSNAMLFVIVNCLLFIINTYFINDICFKLSPVALAVVLGYSLTKRFTSLCHVVLGIGLSLAPIGAFLAVTGYFALPPIFFSLAVLFWVAGFDIIYALQDDQFDKSEGLNSIPVVLGRKNALSLSRVFHLLSATFLYIAGHVYDSGNTYYIGLAAFVLLLIYQHTLVKAHDLSKVNLAFFTTNGVASVVFAIFVIIDLYLTNM